MDKNQFDAGKRQHVKREILRTILVNVVAPYVIYALLKSRMSEFDALIYASIPPVLESVWSIFRRRRIDVMASLVIAGIVLSLGLIALGGGPRLLLIRESFITGLVGLLFLGSLMFSRPIIFYIARETAASGKSAERDWHGRWARPRFRRTMRLMTLLWGTGLLIEAAVRIGMAESLPIGEFLLISPFVQYGLTALLILATVRYVRYSRKIAATAAEVACSKTEFGN